jgi:peroxiredoxin
LNRLIGPLSAVAGILLALCIGVGARLEKGHPPGLPPKPFARLLGKPAPSFEVAGLDGVPVSLHSANGARRWLLYFTNSGCGACDAAYPSLQKATQQLPVVVVGIGDRRQLVEKLAQHAIATATAYDSLGTVQQLYQVSAFPSALLIDQEGLVRQAAIGSQSIEQVLAAWAREEKGGV